MILPLLDLLVGHVGVQRACHLLGRPRASYYRDRRPRQHGPSAPVARPTPPNALSAAEKAEILAVLTSERFVDKSVAQAWATLLDEGVYLASQSTMHRILRANGGHGERRRQARHPAKKKPELLATGPGQVWTWDITKLRGPRRGIWYQLYVVIDIYSRYIVAWTLQHREDSDIATTMLEEAFGVHGIPDAVHADRGTSMTSKTVSDLLMDLGVERSHSRPKVSNDNPYSEAQFKTLKYAPVFPEHFGSITDARTFFAGFETYYNHEHRHSGIGLHTPASVHFGTATQIRAQRQATLDAAQAAHPDRFSSRPEAPKIPEMAWINDPSPATLIQSK